MTCPSHKADLSYPSGAYSRVLSLVELGRHRPWCPQLDLAMGSVSEWILRNGEELQEELAQVDSTQARWLMGKLAWMSQTSTVASQLFSRLMERAFDREAGEGVSPAPGHYGIGWLLLKESLDDWVSDKESPREALKREAADRIREAYLEGATELDLGGFLLDGLPAAIGQLTNLKKVRLTWNQFTEIPPPILSMRGLEEVHLNHCKIKQLPTGFSNWKHLKYLCLSNNHIEVLPSQVRELQDLAILDLKGNQLKGLPSEIGQLWRLQLLSLEENNLEALPWQMGSLQELEILALYNNPGLHALPSSLGRLTKLVLVNHDRHRGFEERMGEIFRQGKNEAAKQEAHEKS